MSLCIWETQMKKLGLDKEKVVQNYNLAITWADEHANATTNRSD